MEREGVIVICLILAFILAVGAIVGILIYMPPSLYLQDELDTLVVGERTQISLASFAVPQARDSFYYASDNPDIISVDENGVITALRDGVSKIYVQSRINNRQKFNFEVTAEYRVDDESEAIIEITEQRLENESSHDFWNRNSYFERILDNNLMEWGGVILEKSKDEYIFTDLFKIAEIRNDNVITLCDWTSVDIDFNMDSIPEINLKEDALAHMGIDGSLLGNYEIWLAENQINQQIRDTIVNYQYGIDFSNFSVDYEYRVCVKLDYSIYKTVNYYSKGLLDSTGSFVEDLFNQGVNSFIDSYAYSKTYYEFELDGCRVIIERRPLVE